MTSSSRSGEQTDPCTLLLSMSRSDVKEKHRACLVVIRGERLGAKVDLDGPAVVIGRGSEADFQIASRSVSRSHCRIFPRDGALWIEDLRSTNQTFVNEQRIDQCELCDGDQVRIGNSVLKYLAAGNLEAGYLAELREHAVRDALTNLYNRRHVMNLLAEVVAKCRADGNYRLALAIIDIDSFKEINDRIGHLAGDAVLQQMAKVLLKCVRSADTLARIGGEEFAVVMPGASEEAAFEACERLRRGVADTAFELDDGAELSVTISIGLSAWRSDMDDISDLMRLADECLYVAKSQGRDRVCRPADRQKAG
jgi:diguanylate cyclase (GGDEF)-like protein